MTPPKSEALFLLSHRIAEFVYADVSRTTGSASVTELRVVKAEELRMESLQQSKQKCLNVYFFHSARAKEQINIETNHFSLCVKGLEPLTPQSVNTYYNYSLFPVWVSVIFPHFK